jgi:hypothetical protein
VFAAGPSTSFLALTPSPLKTATRRRSSDALVDHQSDFHSAVLGPALLSRVGAVFSAGCLLFMVQDPVAKAFPAFANTRRKATVTNPVSLIPMCLLLSFVSNASQPSIFEQRSFTSFRVSVCQPLGADWLSISKTIVGLVSGLYD